MADSTTEPLEEDRVAVVYFVCPKCAQLYRTLQVRRAGPVSGTLACMSCGAPVHRWAGIYDYVFWELIGDQTSLH